MGSVSLKIGDGTTGFRHAIILREIEASEHRLHQIELDLARYETLNPAKLGLPPELKLILARHPLPLSRNSRSDITTMVSFVAHSCACPAAHSCSCLTAIALLSTFMPYRHAASCPTADLLLLSKLISKAPLPASPFPDLFVRLEPQCQEPSSKASASMALMGHAGLARMLYHARHGWADMAQTQAIS